MQFHPLAYLVKLNIEMSMADLIAKISVIPMKPKSHSNAEHRSHSNPNEEGSIPLRIAVKKDVVVQHDDLDLDIEGDGEGEGANLTPSGSSAGIVKKGGDEEGESMEYTDMDTAGQGRVQITKGPLDQSWFRFER